MADFTHSLHRGSKVAASRLDNETAHFQIDANIIHLISIGWLYFGLNIISRLAIIHSQEQPRMAVEGFFVAEENHFVASFDFVAIRFECKGAYRRRGGLRKLGFGFFAHMRAQRKFNLFGGQFHRKGEAGGKLAIFAVGLW